jgi:Zn-dependent peptidase ImmA (M78 family)
MARQDPVVVEFCNKHGEIGAEALVIRLCRELLAECTTERGPSPLDVLGSVRNIRGRRSGSIPHGAACSGLLIPQNGGYEVILNAQEPEERQSFSFAHEIVHTFFREVCPNITKPSFEEEQLCDVGAAELTMPMERFLTQTKGRTLCLSLFDRLQGEFKVSFEAAGRRALGATEDIACLFVAALARTKEQESLDDGEPTLRFVRWTASASWPYKGTYKNRPIDNECIIARSFANLDARSGRGSLGVPFSSSVYDIETRSYEYPRGAVAKYRQVVVLAKGS